MARTPLGKTLPDFPWDSLAGAKKKAQPTRVESLTSRWATPLTQ